MSPTPALKLVDIDWDAPPPWDQQVVAEHFRRHVAKFGPTDVLGIIPLDANVKERLKPGLGKTPGYPKDDGTWSGRDRPLIGPEAYTTAEEIKAWSATDAGVGMTTQHIHFWDNDGSDARIAKGISGIIARRCGAAPVRYGAPGSPRCAHPYRGPGLRKMRVEYWPEGAPRPKKPDALELLAVGQYINLYGPHKSGGMYRWENGDFYDPAVIIPEIDIPTTNSGFDEVCAYLNAEGYEWEFKGQSHAELHSGVRAKTGSGTVEENSGKVKEGTRRRTGADRAPSLNHIATALARRPNEFEDEGVFFDVMMCLYGASDGDENFYKRVIEPWALGWKGADGKKNTPADVRKRWNYAKRNGVEKGWSLLCATLRYLHPDNFDDPTPEMLEDGAGPAPDKDARKAALDRMFATSVYIKGVKRFGDVETGDLMDATDFCVEHRGAADYGLAGTKSADSVFINNKKRGRVADDITYRPGKPAITTEVVNGTGRVAFNTYRPSTLKPAEGKVTDADVAPYREHLDMLFEPADQDHFLNWNAFVVQRPGVKINHGLLMVGDEGLGKDTALEPTKRIVGEHNYKTIDADAIFERFNSHFLPTQLLVINEVHSYRTMEKMNKLKRYLADPPATLTVEPKNIVAYDIPNTVNVVMMTNHDDALALMRGARHYFVCKCRITEKPSKEHFNKFYAWLDNGGAAKVFSWLRARDISQFDHRAPPPVTAAMQAMIELAKPAPVRWCIDQLREGGRFEGRTIVAVRELEELAEGSRNRASREVTDQRVRQAFHEEKFTNLGQVGGRGDGRPRLWSRNPMHAHLPSDQILKRWREERGEAGPTSWEKQTGAA
jgi:hypothetical protein